MAGGGAAESHRYCTRKFPQPRVRLPGRPTFLAPTAPVARPDLIHRMELDHVCFRSLRPSYRQFRRVFGVGSRALIRERPLSITRRLLLAGLMLSCTPRPAIATGDPAVAAAQRLPLEICQRDGIDEAVLCGTLTVPRDRATPAAGTIGLRVVVVPALEGVSLIAWTEHQGGPGFSSLHVARLFQRGGPLERFRRHRDVVLFDQRGVGESGGLSCDALGPNPILRKRFPIDLVDACRAQLAAAQVNLSHYSTSAAVEDLEAIRVWLGYERFDLGGWSYGARFMQLYAQRYPTRVRTLSLIAPTIIDLRRPLEWARFGEQAYARLAAACRADPACARAIPDPQGDLRRVIRRLDEEPVLHAFVHPETGQQAMGRLDGEVIREIFWQAMLGTANGRRLPWLIRRAAQGDFAPLLRDLVATEPGTRWYEPTYLSVVCAEEVPHIRLAEDAEAVRGTVIGRYYLDAWREACRAWDVPLAPDTPPEPRPHDTPTLIITGDVDPVTPPEYGDRIAARLPDSRHHTLVGRAHFGGDLSNEDCFAEVLGDFVNAGTLEGLDTTCLATMQPPPFPTDEVHTRLTWISVAPEDTAAWESAVSGIARAVRASGETSVAAWLVYRAEPSGYLIVSFGEHPDGILAPRAAARTMEDRPTGKEFRTAVAALAATEFTIERDLVKVMRSGWSTVSGIQVATHPHARLVEMVVPLAAAEAFDTAIRTYVDLLIELGYPYPIEGHVGLVGAPGHAFLVYFADAWRPFREAYDVVAWATARGRGEAMRKAVERLDSLVSQFAEPLDLTFAEDLSP